MSMQTSLFGFGVKKRSNSSQELAADEARQVKRARQASEAERLGLEWPEVTPRKQAGRPKHSSLWREALYEALRSGRFDELEQLEDASLPPHWLPGQPLYTKKHEMADLEHALGKVDEVEEVVPAVEGVGEEVAPAVEGVGEEVAPAVEDVRENDKAKRRKKFVSRELQLWFFSWAKCMRDAKGWSQRHSFQRLRSWLPDLYPQNQNK